MEFDVRENAKQEINRIRIEEYSPDQYVVEFLVKDGKGFPQFEDSSADLESLVIISKEHALNIKKAIDKAIELGWWEQ